MGVAVDHAAHAVALEPLAHGRGRDVGDRLGLAAGLQFAVARLARGARLRGEREPRRQRLREEFRLPARIAGLRAELLVGAVVGAQQVAVQQQRRFAVQHRDRGIGQDRHARASRVLLAEQEIAVAADEEYRHAGIGQGAQPVGDEGAGGGRIVVADPGLEQVAEDVERVRAARLAVEEAAEQFRRRRARGVEVQVGNQQRGHGRDSTSWPMPGDGRRPAPRVQCATLSVCRMKPATLSCNAFSEGSCAYTMCPDGYQA